MKNAYFLSMHFCRLMLLAVVALSIPVGLKAQTTLTQGDISIIGFNANSPERGVCFVTWVPLMNGTVIKFTDSGFNNPTPSTNAGNSRWQEQEVTWTATTNIAAGTVIRTADTPPSASTGSLSMINGDGTSVTFWGLSNGSGDQIFAYQGNTPLPAFTTTSTFTGTILSGLAYQGTGANSNWLASGPATSNYSCLPSDLVAPNHIYLTGNATGGQYTGPRSGQSSLASYKTMVNVPANWTVTTGGSAMTTFDLTPFTIAGVAVINAHPSNSTVCAGTSTTFTVNASNATAYQWQENTGSGFTNITNGGFYSGATTATLTVSGAIAGMSGYQYRVVVTGMSGPAATSNAATLTITSAPSIATQPSASTICSGGNTTFSVAAAGAGIGYQWQENSGSGFTNITNGGVYSGATTATLTLTGTTAGMNGYQYRVVASGTCSPAATSNAVTLTVNSAPAVTTQPSNSTICAGANTTFGVVASNATGYQWQQNTGSGFTNITNGGVFSGATTATLTITGATAGMNGYSYRVIVTGACTPAATSNPVTLTINSAPAITTQPSNSMICAGANTTFSVVASNATGYQWQENTGSGFANITNGGVYSNATTATLSITGATAGMNGYQYRVVTTGACTPAATSNAVTLTINSAPAVTTQPSNSTICAAGNTTFSVVASNATGYQWQENTGSGFTNITNGGVYSGATSATLNITGATAGMNGYQYRVVVTGACTPAATSNAVTLTVNSAPSITAQPSASTICAGANTTFSVTASNATGYQWQVDQGAGFSNLANGGVYSGATTATLTITGATGGLNGYIYRVIVTGACTPAATSNSAALTINSAPSITSQPSASTICAGANTTFSVTASNATGYQWQVDQGAGFSNLANGGVYSGATTATLTITGATGGLNGYIYRVIVTGACTPAATSNSAALTVNPAPSIASQPSSSTICAGANTTFSVTASNATGYQWQENTGSGFVNITNGGIYSGATTATLTLTSVTAGMNGYTYRVVATGACTPAATSNNATLTINSAPSITAQPSNSTICAGSNTTFSVTASNATSYQWQVDQGAGFANIANGGVYSGATTATLTLTAATAGMNGYLYRVVVTGVCTPAVTSNAATLTFTSAPAITTSPSSSTICAGANTTFTVSATGATGYQWQVNSGSGFTNITNGGVYSGATTATLTLTNVPANMNGYAYQAVVTGACSPSATSAAVIMTVNALTAITAQPSNSTICAGSNTTFSATASSATGYQWQVNTGSGFTNISNGAPYSGATTATLTITGATAAMNGYTYRVIATGLCAPAATSNSATLTVNSAPAITAQPVNSTICAGANTTFSATVTNATSYQWQVNTGSGFTNISNGAPYSGATTATLTISGATAGMNGYTYQLVATGICSPAGTSSVATLTVNALTAISSQPAASTICAGANTTFSVTATNATSYQWQENTGSGFVNITNGGVFSGATTATLTITGATAGMNGYTYRVIVSGICAPAATSNAVALTVNTAPVITGQPTSNAICPGTNTLFAATATGSGLTYQWQVNTGSGFTNILNGGVYSGATTPLLSITGATTLMNGYIYRLVVSGTCSPAATSSSATLTINAAPTITTDPADSTLCAGGNAAFSVTAANATGYQWQVNTGSGFTNISNGAPYSGATTATLTVTGTTAGMNGYRYRAVVSGLCTPNATSDEALLTVNSIPAQPGPIAGLQTVCEGSEENYVVVNNPAATSYNWTLPANWTGTSNSNVIATTTGLSGTISVTASNICGTSPATTATITTIPAYSVTNTVAICQGDSALINGNYEVAAGLYTASYTTVNGCDSTINTVLVVNQVYFITQDASICQGDSILINGVYETTAGTYLEQFSTASSCDSTIQTVLTVTPSYFLSETATICAGDSILLGGAFQTTAGTYIDAYTTVNGCDSIISTTLTVTPLPVVTLTLSADTVCQSVPVFALGGGSPAGGIYSGTGVSGTNFTPATAGVGLHTITYTATADGCSASATDNIYVDECLGVDEWASGRDISVYPNPHSNVFTLKVVTDNPKNMVISLNNELGQRLMLIEAGEIGGTYEKQIHTDELPSGVYFLTVTTSEGTAVKRIVK